ncbi:NTP transferase domain-containing protein [Diaminobutyricibacter sp. McL0608]|uniref:NTP transferase domain-containing protein n=1 Tax=Leifsonia sp. McL0608 TaxID=3143537 RepID=UPI0031F2EB69
MPARADVDAVILAGGRARRLGGLDKGALVFEGSTLVERALAAADGAAHRIVVGDAAPASVPPGVRVVREEPVHSGPASAVMAGVDALASAGSTATWALVIACDVVHSAEVTGVLLAGADAHPDADGFVPVDGDGHRQVLIGLYRVAALRAARDAIGGVADSSMKRLLESLRLVEVAVGAGATADVDTPEQAAALGIGLPPAPTLLAPTVADARLRAHELGAARLTGHRRLAVESAAGLTLADDVVAETAVPAFNNSAMDGWAVAGPGPWRLGEPIHAGDDIDESPLEEGTAHRIMTGAEVPPGTWAVVRREDGIDVAVPAGTPQLSLREGLPQPRGGHHIRPAGEEASAGEAVLRRGQVLTPPRLGLAAACGVDTVSVRNLPTVELVVVGDELVGAGTSGGGKIRDALTPQLIPLIESIGGRATGAARVGDHAPDIETAIQRSAADVIVVTGGTSLGDADHTRAVLNGLGARLLIDGILSRPGRPALVAHLESGSLVICLPGNPLAAMLASLVLLCPMLDGMLGRPLNPLPQVRLGSGIPNPRPGALLVPSRMTPDGSAAPADWTDSGMLRGLALADLVAVVPPGGTPADDLVDALPLPWNRKDPV